MSSAFEWSEERSKAALALAEGCTQQETAKEVGVTDRTIRNWLTEPEFATEVDRLSLMIGIASRAERLRLANRVIRAKIKEGVPETEKDLLDWLKFAQSETDGVRLDLTKLAAALSENDAPVADQGSPGTDQSAGPTESVR
jgi:predicted transcriptional regulator